MALIGEDCSVTLVIGSQVLGALTFGTLASITGFARKITTKDSVELTNTKALADARKKHRPHDGMTEVTVEGVTPYTGFNYLTSGATPIGLPVKLVIKPLSSLSTGQTFVGICESWESEISMGEATIERLMIRCDADGA